MDQSVFNKILFTYGNIILITNHNSVILISKLFIELNIHQILKWSSTTKTFNFYLYNSFVIHCVVNCLLFPIKNTYTFIVYS